MKLGQAGYSIVADNEYKLFKITTDKQVQFEGAEQDVILTVQRKLIHSVNPVKWTYKKANKWTELPIYLDSDGEEVDLSTDYSQLLLPSDYSIMSTKTQIRAEIEDVDGNVYYDEISLYRLSDSSGIQIVLSNEVAQLQRNKNGEFNLEDLNFSYGVYNNKTKLTEGESENQFSVKHTYADGELVKTGGVYNVSSIANTYSSEQQVKLSFSVNVLGEKDSIKTAYFNIFNHSLGYKPYFSTEAPVVTYEVDGSVPKVDIKIGLVKDNSFAPIEDYSVEVLSEEALISELIREADHYIYRIEGMTKDDSEIVFSIKSENGDYLQKTLPVKRKATNAPAITFRLNESSLLFTYDYVKNILEPSKEVEVSLTYGGKDLFTSDVLENFEVSANTSAPVSVTKKNNKTFTVSIGNSDLLLSGKISGYKVYFTGSVKIKGADTVPLSYNLSINLSQSTSVLDDIVKNVNDAIEENMKEIEGMFEDAQDYSDGVYDKVKGELEALEADPNTITINGVHMKDGTVGAEKIVAKSITAGQIEAGAIDAGLIKAEAVEAKAIKADSAFFDKLTTSEFWSESVNAAEINAGSINTGTLSADRIEAGSIEIGKLAEASFDQDANGIVRAKTMSSAISASEKSILLSVESTYETLESQKNKITNVDVLYAQSTSQVVAPSTGWQSEAPAYVEGQYIWTKTIKTFGSGATQTEGPVCMSGSTGLGVKTIQEYYYWHNSTTVAPPSNAKWETSPGTWREKEYLWTRTYLEYTDGTNSTTAEMCVSGAPGADGNNSKTVSISGEQVFKYREDFGELVGPANITLYTSVQGVDSPQYLWKVKPSGGSWTTLSDKTANLSILPTGSVWGSAKSLVYRCELSPTIYDEFTVTKVSDGADAYSVILSNENHTYAVEANGQPSADVSTTATVSVYKGTEKVPASIGAITSGTSGLTTSLSGSTITITMTKSVSASATSGSFIIPVSANGLNFEKTFSWSKAIKGATGSQGPAGTHASYVLISGDQVFKYTTGVSTPSPASINLTAQVFNLSGGGQWYYRVPGSTTNITISGATTTSYSLSPSASFWGSNKSLTFRYQVGDRYDEITVAKVEDGAVGPQGPQGNTGSAGADAYTVLLGNESHSFPVESNGHPSSTVSTTTEVIAFKGASAIAPSAVSVSGTPTGITTSVSGAKVTINMGTSSPSATSGTFNINVTVDGKSFAKVFSWTKAIKGATGATGPTGSAGISITAVDVEYGVSSSSTTAPTSWSTTTPSWTDGQYIWSRTKTTYSSGSPTYSKPACITGGKGSTGASGTDGKGIKSTAVTYQASSSGTAAPTGTWSTSIPSVSAGQYLWTRTVITYTDNSTSTSYSVGMKGATGATGSTGNGVSSAAVTYQRSSSGTTPPTGSWVTSVPTESSDTPYLWTRTITTYTNGTTSTAYAVASLGKSVSAIAEEYYLSTSKTTQSGGSWASTPPTWTAGKYMWTRSKITYVNPSSTAYTTPYCDSSWEAIDGIEIGGRNLFLNSDFNDTQKLDGETDKHHNLYPISWSGYNSGITNPTTNYHAHIDNDTFGFNVVEFNESDGTRHWKGLSQGIRGRFVDDTSEYILSLDAFTTLVGAKIFGGFYYTKKGSTTASFHSGQFTLSTVLPLNEWGRVSTSVPLKNDVDFSKPISFYVYGYGFSSNAILYIKNIQLQLGNKPTDWTPAPEDTQEQIDIAYGLNQWKRVKYNKTLSSASVCPKFSDIATLTPVWEDVFTDQANLVSGVPSGDHFIVHLRTNVYVSADKTVAFTPTSNVDDTATFYLNNQVVAEVPNTEVANMPFKKGWNSVDILFYEHAGGESFTLNKKFSDNVDKLGYSIGFATVASKSEVKAAIDIAEASITSKVSNLVTNTTFSGVEKRLSEAEQKILPDAITNTVTSSSSYKNNNLAATYVAMISQGKPLTSDPVFKSGNNGISIYSNSGVAPTVSRITKPSDAPTVSTHALQFQHTGASNPHLGGFINGITARANAVFVQKFVAKLPSGYQFNDASNSIGTGGKSFWFGSRLGTGKYETYHCIRECGGEGTFSSSGHIYISGPTPTTSAPLVWQLASSELYDVTNIVNEAEKMGIAIRDGGVMETASTTLTKDKFEVKGAAFRVVDSSGVLALNANTSGEMFLRRKMQIGGSAVDGTSMDNGALEIKNSSNATIFHANKDGIKAMGTNFSLYGSGTSIGAGGAILNNSSSFSFDGTSAKFNKTVNSTTNSTTSISGGKIELWPDITTGDKPSNTTKMSTIDSEGLRFIQGFDHTAGTDAHYSRTSMSVQSANIASIISNVTFPNNTELSWSRNTDYAKIGFKNDSDGDTDSFMYFRTGDNGNEHFKWQCVSGPTTTELMKLNTANLYYKGHGVYHAGNKPTAAETGALPTSGGTMSSGIIFNSAATGGLSVNNPGQIGYNGGLMVSSYANLKLFANTDATTGVDTEYVHIASARGTSPTTSQGLIVAGSYMNFNGQRVHTHNTNLSMGSQDIYFNASDSGDIVWQNGSGTEMGRIYRPNSGTQGLFFRSGNGTAPMYLDTSNNLRVPKSVYKNGSEILICSNDNSVTNIKYVGGGPYFHFDRSGGASGVNCWTSDERIKDNLTQLSVDISNLMVEENLSGLDLIKSINHYSFDYKEGGHVPVGYSANQLKELNPSLVFAVKQPEDGDYYEEGDEGLLHPDHTILIPNITMAMQQQQKMLEETLVQNNLLSEENRELKNRLDKLEELVATLLP